MRFCPNAACPHRSRVGAAAEFGDTIDVCSDCGSQLHPGEAPLDAPPAASNVGAPALKDRRRRLAVTLAAVPAILLGERVPLPGVDPAVLLWHFKEQGETGAVPDAWLPSHSSVIGLGLMPLITSFLLVEIAALVVPPWSRLRHAGPEGRSKLNRAVLLLGLAIAIFQGFAVARSMNAMMMLGTTGVVGLKIVALITMTLVAGTFLLLALASLLDRYGLANGFATVTMASFGVAIAGRSFALPGAFPESYSYPPAFSICATLAAAIVVGGATLGFLSGRRGEPRDPEKPAEEAEPRAAYRSAPNRDRADGLDVPVPASGILPLTLAPTLVFLPATLASPNAPTAFVGWLLESPGALFVVKALVTLLLVVVLGTLFNFPAHLATLGLRLGHGAASRDDLEDAAEARLRRALLRTLLFFAVIFVIHEILVRNVVLLNAFEMILFTAFAVDIAAEWRARGRTPDLVAVWPEHRPCAVGIARVALARAGIAVFARSAHQRTLFQLFGPYIPIELMVPASSAEQAREELRRVLPSSPDDEFAERGYLKRRRNELLHRAASATQAVADSPNSGGSFVAIGTAVFLAFGALLLLAAPMMSLR